MHKFLILILFFSLQNLHAAVKINSVSGASNYDLSTDTATPIIYGGTSGTACAGNGTSTCNSCTAAGTACNNSRIYNSLTLQINFTVTGSLTGPILAGDTNNNLITSTKPTGDFTTGDTTYIQFTWSNLCTTLGAADCETLTSMTKTLRLAIDGDKDGVIDEGEYASISIVVHRPSTGDFNTLDCNSTNSTGICNFIATAGDEKVAIESLETTDDGFPNAAGVKVSHVRIYYYPSLDFNDVGYNLGSSNYIDISLVDDGKNLSNKFVTGLTNKQSYVFKAAVKDLTQNVYGLMSSTAVDNACATKTDATCDLIATPDEVFGLLTEDLNCFITTVAYGSSFSEKVITFRKFRNQFLVPHTWGRKIIFWYYDIGPKAARTIDQSPVLKTISRIILWPFWAFAKISLKTGLPIALFFATLFFIGAIIGLLQLRKCIIKKA